MREIVMRVPDDHPVLKPREIVRCKECRWYYITSEGKSFCCNPTGGMVCAEPTDFCSRGERKSNVDSHNSDWNR